ncbi:hypothetical protein B0187_08535 [Haemophilus paracuniculus]|uniref:Uncharacterized protein n=2 Tax=Haemophilus paracuniculus TaxID=734 RepID=A0A1T0AQK1_9PAST|nr:hypothetical protein B0187_08535 [Haemophilus paracuniculus]
MANSIRRVRFVTTIDFLDGIDIWRSVLDKAGYRVSKDLGKGRYQLLMDIVFRENENGYKYIYLIEEEMFLHLKPAEKPDALVRIGDVSIKFVIDDFLRSGEKFEESLNYFVRPIITDKE